jgi:hypothetical protein
MWKIACLLAFLWFSTTTFAHGAQISLDGKQFAIDLQADAEDKQDKKAKPPGSDTIVFAEGKGDCVLAGKAFGYDKAAYTATAKGKDVEFTFTMTSTKHGELRLSGVISGKTITGQRVWSKPSKTPITHTFTGKQQ